MIPCRFRKFDKKDRWLCWRPDMVIELNSIMLVKIYVVGWSSSY